jgi:hypothetical protein
MTFVLTRRHILDRCSLALPPAKTTLRADVSGAAHTPWALTFAELYVLRIKESGGHPDDYQHWLADVLTAALLAR